MSTLLDCPSISSILDVAITSQTGWVIKIWTHDFHPFSLFHFLSLDLPFWKFWFLAGFVNSKWTNFWFAITTVSKGGKNWWNGKKRKIGCDWAVVNERKAGRRVGGGEALWCVAETSRCSTKLQPTTLCNHVRFPPRVTSETPTTVAIRSADCGK